MGAGSHARSIIADLCARCVGIVVACYFASLSILAASAAGQLLTVAVVPSEIALTTGASATGTLSLVNTGSTEAQSVHVRAVAAATSITVKMDVADAAIAGGGSASLSFKVTRSSEGSGQDVPVRFVVTYRQAPDSSSPAVSQTVVGTLNIKAVVSPQLVEAKFESNLSSINENRPGEAALIVSNLRDTPITITTIYLSAPDKVDITLDCPGGKRIEMAGGSNGAHTDCVFGIDPRSQEMLHLHLATKDSVTPGPRTLIIRLTAHDKDTGATATTVASLPFTIDVFAEADILKSIGVPIFLLLPGVIVVATYWGLIQAASPFPWKENSQAPTPAGSLALIGTTSIAAVIALGISLFIAIAVYPLATHLVIGQQRNYLQAYGFRDFYYAFILSFVIALVLWGIVWLVAPLHRRLLVPAPDDEPSAVFRKLILRGLIRRDTRLRRVKVSEIGKGLVAGHGPNGWVVVPTIQVWFPAGPPTQLPGPFWPEMQTRASQLWSEIKELYSDVANSIGLPSWPGPPRMTNPVTGLQAQIESNAASGSVGHTWRLWRSIEAAKNTTNRGVMSFRAGDVPGPIVVTDDSKITLTGQRGAIVEVAGPP